MITDKDVEKLKETFATKDDLEELEVRIAKSFNQNEQRMTGIEENIIGAINKLQIENSITAIYRPKIENHEQRITKLGNSQFAN